MSKSSKPISQASAGMSPIRKASASAGDQCATGAPLGQCSADEPPNTLPAEPVSISKVSQPKQDKAGAATSAGFVEEAGAETPALHQEADIPSDGSDPVGEAMMREIPGRKGEPGQGGTAGREAPGRARDRDSGPAN